MQSIIKALTHIFPSPEEYKKEFNSMMFHALEEQLQMSSNCKNIEYVCQKVLEQALKTDIILNNFELVNQKFMFF